MTTHTTPALPTDSALHDYVIATAALLDLPIDAARANRVAMHLGRTAAMAQVLDAVVFDWHEEPAEIYCPAAFPPLYDLGRQL